MSVFSNSVRSTIIDPDFSSDRRVSFRLANRGESWMPTMRIGNMGLQKDAQNNNKYQFAVGSAAVVDRIQLMDGNEPLDSLRNVGNWLAFQNSIRSNSQNTNVFNQMVGGSVGWANGATGELLSNDPKYVREGSEDTLGTLDLRTVFPLLNNISHLSTKLFKNLRIVVEYHVDTRALVKAQTPADLIAGLKKSQPILIVDEIIDEALIASLDKQLQFASWTAIEHDQVSVPAVGGITAASAVATSAVQNSNFRINGFTDKTVGRLMISKVYQDLANYVYDSSDAGDNSSTSMKAYSQLGSKALHKEAFNIRVNGRNVLAGAGVDTPASMAMLCADVWGELNCCHGQITESVGLDTKYDLTQTNTQGAANVPAGGKPPSNFVGVNKTFPRILSNGGVKAAGGATWTTNPTAESGVFTGNSSWIGVGVHDRVSEMSVNLTRTGTPTSVRTPGTRATDQPVASAGNYQALNLHLFAEVQKRLVVNGGDYKIVYV